MRADNQSTIALHLVTNHGGVTPLIWLTVDKDELKNHRNDFEDGRLSRLKALLPEGVVVTILADRGFGDVKLFKFLVSLGFGYVIRFRGNIHVSTSVFRQAQNEGSNEVRRRLGGKGRPSLQAARRRNHRRPPNGWRGGVREGKRNEGGLASGRN
jgi:hypothetical protein